MANSAHLDSSSFLVPCKHCGALLQERERVCPFCGEGQSVGAGPAKSILELEREASDEGDTLPPFEAESTVMPRQKLQEAIGRPVPDAATAAIKEMSFEVAHPGPESIWQKEVPERGGLLRRAGGSGTTNRLAISIVAVLVLVGLALALDYFYFDKQSEPGRLREFRSNVAQVQSALSRGDLTAAERVLDVLDADHADDPGVQQLREELYRREQEHEAKHEQLRDAARKAARALGLAEPAAPAAQAPPPPKAPVVAVPATRAAHPKEKQCNEALAALALCPKESEPEPGRDTTKVP